MSLFVRAKVSSLSKGFAAYTASEWLFACMTTDMSLEVPALRKRKAAVFLVTDVWS